MTDEAGTLDYMPPEMLMDEEYDEGCDMWALGVAAYILLAGEPPFFDPDDAKVKTNIKTINYNFSNKEHWGHISDNCKEWIEQLLTPADERMTAD